MVFVTTLVRFPIVVSVLHRIWLVTLTLVSFAKVNTSGPVRTWVTIALVSVAVGHTYIIFDVVPFNALTCMSIAKIDTNGKIGTCIRVGTLILVTVWNAFCAVSRVFEIFLRKI